MLRGLATLGILALLALDVALPWLPTARRGADPTVRAEVSSAVGTPGELLPELALLDLEGNPLRLSDMRGYPTVIAFERSVDW
jgi:hypothetical protein